METAQMAGAESYLVDDVSMVDESWFFQSEVIGISAGASAPERVISEAVEFFRGRGYMIENFEVLEENMRFTPPLELLRMQKQGAQA
jgi:4-hydroxy-3-methylbut-2-enyl diphosphate reductase